MNRIRKKERKNVRFWFEVLGYLHLAILSFFPFQVFRIRKVSKLYDLFLNLSSSRSECKNKIAETTLLQSAKIIQSPLAGSSTNYPLPHSRPGVSPVEVIAYF